MSRSGAKWRAVFVTLTYRPGVVWKPNHVRSFVDCVRKWGDRQGVKVGYLWVAEMQERGAVHYHAVIWIPSRLQLPRPDRRGWWPHGSTNVQTVKRNAVGYLMKYVSKGVGGGPDLPKGARVCGSGGLDDMARAEFHYWRLPRYVRENIVIGDRCARAVGGGWYSRRTGEHWQSAYGVYAFCERKRMGDDGRKLRSDTITLLSDRWRRWNTGVEPICPHVVMCVELANYGEPYSLRNDSFSGLALRFGWMADGWGARETVQVAGVAPLDGWEHVFDPAVGIRPVAC